MGTDLRYAIRAPAPVAAIVVVGPERLLPLKNLPSIRRALRDAAGELEEILEVIEDLGCHGHVMINVRYRGVRLAETTGDAGDPRAGELPTRREIADCGPPRDQRSELRRRKSAD